VREAHAVAALNHPNILSIFGFGAHGDTTDAVMELLEGETLRDRLKDGAAYCRGLACGGRRQASDLRPRRRHSTPRMTPCTYMS